MMPARIAVLLRVLLLAALACVMAGCGSDAPKPQEREKPRIGLLLYKDNDVYVGLVRDAALRVMAGKAELLVEYGKHDQFLQNDQFDAMIAQKVSAVIVNLVDVQAASDFVDKAKKAKIPLIFFNREPDMKILRSYDKARFVGTSVFEAGIMQGDIIAELWAKHPEYDRNKDGQLQYVMFQGNADNPEALARTEYSVRRARERGVPMRQIGETYICNWEEGLAHRSMQGALAMHGDAIEMVIANNDSMALGAIAALAEHGYNKEGNAGSKFIPVVGVDAIPQAVEAINKKVMSATVRQDGEAMGDAIATMALNAVDGKGFLDGTPYAWDEFGLAVRIPYSPYSGQ